MMHLLVWDDMSTCTEADVTRMLPLVAPSRREKALRYRHLHGQWTCLKAAEMLLPLLPNEEWTYNEYGKPYLTGGPHFSISHCRCGVAVAVCERPIGVDIETIRTPSDGLIERVMNADEQTWIAEQADLAEAFTYLWTQKEAVLKLRGTGIIDDLKNVLVNAGERITTTVHRDKNYVLSVAQIE